MNTMMFPRNQVSEEIYRDTDSLIDYAFTLIDQAVVFAVVPVSNFRVGAVVIDGEGNFYLGANQEYENAAITHTIHAEQSAIANAWVSGAKTVTHLIVNYTPCGHCRQFINELASANTLAIHLPHQRHYHLSDLLPDKFGPENLGITMRIFDDSLRSLPPIDNASLLVQQAWYWAKRSYAPYSGQYAGMAIEDEEGNVYGGAYLESSAFNPSLPALQTALNGLHLAGKTAASIRSGALVSKLNSGHVTHTTALWHSITAAPLVCEVLDI